MTPDRVQFDALHAAVREGGAYRVVQAEPHPGRRVRESVVKYPTTVDSLRAVIDNTVKWGTWK